MDIDPMRVAFLADIHGNLPALEAVICDLDSQGVDAVFLAGDQVNRCPWSSEVADIVTDRGWPAIYGNHEKVLCMLADPHTPGRFDNRHRFPDLWWTLEHLNHKQVATLKALPAERRLDFGVGPAIRLVHGVPGNPFRGLFLDEEEADVADDLVDVDEHVIVCAHTHQPLHRSVGSQLIINGGSVGIPYNDDTRAQYVILELVGDRWVPMYRRVEYRVERVREGFHSTGMYGFYGPLAEISIRAIETAQPWTSDFAHWLNHQESVVQDDLVNALRLYEKQHGPGRWSFLQEVLG